MATTNITGEEFNSTVRGEGITLVDFWASWCGPCMQFGPVYERASEANPDITFAKVDTDAEQGLARRRSPRRRRTSRAEGRLPTGLRGSGSGMLGRQRRQGASGSSMPVGARRPALCTRAPIGEPSLCSLRAIRYDH